MAAVTCETRLGIAVSGGPDSVALLLLANAAFPTCVEAATVDHGLRPQSGAEADWVARLCDGLNIPHRMLPVSVSPGNLQSKARDARYAALAVWAAERELPAIATAHHADDQAETLLMRLNRASGIDGLAGIRERLEMPYDGFGQGTAFWLIRPLLGFRRSELISVVDGAGQAFVSDPSNVDDSYDRVRMRKVLSQADWLDPSGVAASASHLADALDALNHAFWPLYNTHVRRREHHGEVDVWLSLPEDTPRYFLFQAVDTSLRSVGGDPRGGDVARLLERLLCGEGGNVAGVLVTVEGGGWYFRREPTRRAQSAAMRQR